MTDYQTLQQYLQEIAPLAVAVSGGVDSMTLAVIAHRTMGEQVTMFHAVSAAVPSDATDRVQDYAQREGWQLKVIDAGEFGDQRYRQNPANRCFFCKTNLYGAMTALTDKVLVSGTNTDDLGDYRPGLQAAAEHNVRHPYVEVGIDKQGVRALAHDLGLDDVAELPAAPCLSSRIETGIVIDPAMLTAVNSVERLLRSELKPKTVRCRVRQAEVCVELDEAALIELAESQQAVLSGRISALFANRRCK